MFGKVPKGICIATAPCQPPAPAAARHGGAVQAEAAITIHTDTDTDTDLAHAHASGDTKATKRETVDVRAPDPGSGRQPPKLTEELPPIPFVHQYQNGNYFCVRECCDHYCKLVKGMLDGGKKCVTVTGTTGVGTSVFYAYFFSHFRKEETETWVIAMSIVMKDIAEVAGFKSGNDAGEQLARYTSSKREVVLDMVLEEAYVKKKKVLILCDGVKQTKSGGLFGWSFSQAPMRNGYAI